MDFPKGLLTAYLLLTLCSLSSVLSILAFALALHLKCFL